MIEEMRLKDLGVIAEATLPMGPGFTAITGETGAGKTMVVTGLGLLLGARADSGAVRRDANAATVSGVWIVPSSGPVTERVADAGGDVEPLSDGNAELYVSRTLTAEGRSRASVGGRNAPASVLGEIGSELVVMHGQSDQLRLRSSTAQRAALDRFGGVAVADALATYQRHYERYEQLGSELQQLQEQREARQAEAQQLREDIAQIEALSPEAGEDEALAARAGRLENMESLRFAATAAREALSSEEDATDVTGLLGEARRALEKAADADLVALTEQLDEVSFRVADIAGSLSSYLADLDEGGPRELEELQDRRAALTAIARIHGSLDAAIALLSTGSQRLVELDDDDDRIQRLHREVSEVQEALDAAAAALSAARTRAAAGLGTAVTEELHALALPDATFAVEVTKGAASSYGRDDVAFLLAPHPGASLRSVAKTASGGELSRVMLAVEVVLASVDAVPTFVFDEIDAGIGGAAAIEVGRRLAELAKTSQVIAVTHLAQVAAFANNHLSVMKANDGTVTASSVMQLEGADREAEMARLLSGMADSDAALTHARELLSLGEAARAVG